MYLIYKHTTPCGKVYIGITKQKQSARWRHGNGYKTQPYFYKAIQKYGWDNIEHLILDTCETLQEANEIEKYYILTYKSNNPEFGYNLTAGGDGSPGHSYTPSKESIERGVISRSWYKHHSLETRAKISIANKGKTVSPDVRKKISDSVKKLYLDADYVRRVQIATSQANCTSEHRKNLSESHKGYVMPDSQKQKIRDGNMGKKQSDNTKKLLSKIVKEQHEKERALGIKRKYSYTGSGVIGTHWCNNGVINKRVTGDIPDGFVAGRLPSGNNGHKQNDLKPSDNDGQPKERKKQDAERMTQRYKSNVDVF